MTLHQATADYYAGLRRIDQMSAEAAQSAAVLDAREQAVIDYWRTMPRPYAVATHADPNRDSPGYYVVTVQCPYCPRSHFHGWGGPGDTGGHRAAHCTDDTARTINGRGYVISIPADLKGTR